MSFDVSIIIDSIARILASPLVTRATERLSTAFNEQAALMLVKMRRKVAFVAAIGSQGCGKSSLLNSLIFSRRLLPTGVGVTTNVICFVHSSAGSSPWCEVTFKDGRVERVPLDLDTLHGFMNEANNPKNEKRVTSVSCFTEAALLTDSTSFVDTPGLGALSEHDTETMSFVKDLSLGLFVLRATPPLTAPEIEYLEAIWLLCPEFIFVQNTWGESPDQVAASLQENERLIGIIAKRRSDDRPINICSLDIHAALEDAANGRSCGESASQLNLLKKRIRANISRGGQRFEIEAQCRQLVLCLNRAIAAGQKEILSASIKSDAEMEGLRGELRHSLELIDRIENKHAQREYEFRSDCNDLVQAFRNAFSSRLRSLCTDFQAHVRRDGGYKGIEVEFRSRIRQLVDEAISNFQHEIRDIANMFVEASASTIEQIEWSVKVKPSTVSIEDVSSTHTKEVIGKVATAVGQTTLTALTALGRAQQ